MGDVTDPRDRMAPPDLDVARLDVLLSIAIPHLRALGASSMAPGLYHGTYLSNPSRAKIEAYGVRAQAVGWLVDYGDELAALLEARGSVR